MDIFNSSMLQQQSKEYMDALVGAVEAALYPFKTGGVTIWYEDGPSSYREMLLTVEIKTVGSLRLKIDRERLLNSYLDASQIVAAEVYEHVKNRPTVAVDNPNIVLGEE